MSRRPSAWLTLTAILCAPLLSGCGVHGLHLEQSPLFKYFEKKSGNIAYIGQNGNVFVTDQVGHSIQVTADGQSGVNAAVSYEWPTWAPNGRALLFLRDASGEPGAPDTSQLYVADVLTGGLRRLFSSTILQPFYFYWAPDSRKIAVLSSTNDGGILDLGVLSASSSDSYRPLDAGSPYYWVWSRDSSTIIAHADFEGRFGGNLTFIPVDHPAERKELQLTLGLFEAPDATAEGRAIVALQPSEGGNLFQRTGRIVAVGPSGAATTIVSSSRIVFFALSPDGKELAYLEPEPSRGALTNVLHVAPLRDPRKGLSIDDRLVLCFFWAPNGREIAYFTTDTSKRPIDPVFAQGSNLPKTELRVLDVKTKKSWSVARFPASQGLLNIFPYMDQYERSETIWSPDSRYLVFTADTSQGGLGGLRRSRRRQLERRRDSPRRQRQLVVEVTRDHRTEGATAPRPLPPPRRCRPWA